MRPLSWRRPRPRQLPGICISLIVASLLFTPAADAQRTALPTGFGPLSLGMTWDEASESGTFTELTRFTSAWERHVYACGYRSARFTLADGSVVLVTAQDHTVSHLTSARAIEPGRSVLALARSVARDYGQAVETILRDDLGAVTLDPGPTRHALLRYDEPRQARISISGEPQWELRITVSGTDARQLENRTIRCARKRERDAAAGGTPSS